MSEVCYWSCWIAAIALYIAVLCLLVLAYRRTRNTGFLWLVMALVLWPLVSHLTGALYQHFLSELRNDHRPWLYPYSRMSIPPCESGQIPPGVFRVRLEFFNLLLGQILLFVGLVALIRNMRSQRSTQPPPGSQ